MLQTGIILSFIFIVLVVAFAYLYSDKSSRNRDPNAVWEDMARKQIAHQYVGVHATPEVLNTAKEEVKKEEIKEEKKKSIVGTGNLLDMIN